MSDGQDDARGFPDDEPGREGAPEEATSKKTPMTQQLGRIVVLLLLLVFIVFALSNSQPVDFDWVLGETQVTDDPGTGEPTGGVPLIVLLLAAFVIGALSGAMFVRLRQRRTRAAERDR